MSTSTARTLSASQIPDRFITPPRNQGQIVEVSYGDGCDGLGWRRTYDRSDRSTAYAVCNMANCGCEGDCNCWEPWNRAPSKFDWAPVTIKD